MASHRRILVDRRSKHTPVKLCSPCRPWPRGSHYHKLAYEEYTLKTRYRGFSLSLRGLPTGVH